MAAAVASPACTCEFAVECWWDEHLKAAERDQLLAGAVTKFTSIITTTADWKLIAHSYHNYFITKIIPTFNYY